MRTTLPLEDDVAARVRKVIESRRVSLKSVVNEALRRGLDVMEHPPAEASPYRIRPRSLGRCLVPDLDSVAQVLAHAEGENFR